MLTGVRREETCQVRNMIRDGPAGWLRGALSAPSSFDSVHDRVHSLACLQPGLIRPSLVSPRFLPLHGGGIRKSLRRERRFANSSGNFSAAASSKKPGRTLRRGESPGAGHVLLLLLPFAIFNLCSRERRKEKGKRGRNCDRTVCCDRVMQMRTRVGEDKSATDRGNG